MKFERVEIVETESRFRDVKYVLIGAFYGFLIGNAFVISAAMVDRLLYPDLPLGFDWSLFAMRWGWIAVGLTLTGVIAALFSEKLPSLLTGAAVAGFVALVSALYVSPVSMGMKLIILVFVLAPMSAICLPVILLLRWLVDKHEQAVGEHKQPALRIASLILLVIVLGAGSGQFLKLPPNALEATRFLHDLLQAAPSDAKSPLRDLPGFQSHANLDYQLFQQPSETSTEGFDVRAEYEDGYSLNCVVVVYPGHDPYLSDCSTSTQD